jgi:hypothetical protein
MANEQKPNPATGQESDISKSQAQQQPAAQAGQQAETGQQGGQQFGQSGQFETSQQSGAEQTGDQAATGQAQPGAGPDEALQGDTLAQQRTDIEGGSLGSEDEDEAGTGFVGSKGEGDTSSELVDEQQFDKDGQGAPEGK